MSSSSSNPPHAAPSQPHAGLTLSKTQMTALESVERTMSIISILGCLFIITSFMFCAALKRKTFNRLLYLASYGNLMSNVATLIGPAGAKAGSSSATCKTQATLIQWFIPADCLWTFCMAVNVFLTFQTTKLNVDLRKLEKWYFLFCFGVPSVPALTYLFLDLTKGTDYYGNATLWCWIGRKHENLRLITFYVPVWVMIVITMILYAITGRAIYKGQVRNKLMKNALSNEPDSTSWSLSRCCSPPPRLGVVTRTEISQVSESICRLSSLDASSIRSSTLADAHSSVSTLSRPPHAKFIPIRVPGFGDGTASPPGTATALSPPPSPPATISSPRSESRITTTITTHPTSPLTPISPLLQPQLVMPSRHASFASTRQSLAPSSRLIDSSSRTNRGAKTYAQVAFLLYVVMLIVWVPSSANRVYGVVRPTQVNFGLNVAAAVVLPLQGFFNTLIYLFTSRRELFGRFRKQRAVDSSSKALEAPSRPETKNSWHRPESREELEVADDEDEDDEITDVEALRFPWHEKKDTRAKITEVE